MQGNVVIPELEHLRSLQLAPVPHGFDPATHAPLTQVSVPLQCKSAAAAIAAPAIAGLWQSAAVEHGRVWHASNDSLQA
jgi:hypothetical protein